MLYTDLAIVITAVLGVALVGLAYVLGHYLGYDSGSREGFDEGYEEGYKTGYADKTANVRAAYDDEEQELGI
jgi:hypothetical protein